ncbi:MurR/RpiR family transcriptional regulator [Alkalihalobacillus sp. TS-13]|uniref:MurR/RpiR family transcriptional regulator n=1 Tax=Alkalihalobacillus sp. TS-13 TaxID=2842455 RepID=UPI001C868F8C|nr:MurR/RpiR family transcriptional regulator [Alkalihalobacillus sp. TS-13]
MDHINEKIREKFNALTKRQKTVAKYLIDHPQKVAIQTAKEIGANTETSETTVIRLCYTLGFSGFSELQKQVSTFLIEKNHNDPLENYRESTGELSAKDNLIQHIMKQDVASIEKTFSNLSDEMYQKIIDAILQSEKRFIVGLRSSFPPANWLHFSLNIVKGDTFLYKGEIDDAIYMLTEIDKECLVIAFSFPRYIQETVSFVSAAKKKGAKVLTITDDPLSPVGVLSDWLIKVDTPSPAALSGMTPIFSVLNVLVSGVASSEWKDVGRRINEYEQVSQEFSPFYKK